MSADLPCPFLLDSAKDSSTRIANVIIEGQVTPFYLPTADGEKLFCWHVLPLDVYFEHETELANLASEEALDSDDFIAGLGAKLLRKDAESKLVVNFHGVSFSSLPFSMHSNIWIRLYIKYLIL